MVLTALFPKAVHSSFEQKGDFLQFSKTSLYSLSYSGYLKPVKERKGNNVSSR